jgi:predicted dehydrogenase
MGDLKVAVLGIDHRHCYGMLAGMQDVGCTCVGWWTEGQPGTLDGFVKRFPDIPRVADRAQLLADPQVDLVLIADIPARRADLAIEAMQAGKDVMTDKPGCTTMEQLQRLQETVAHTGRIWSIDFSERFEVPCVARAAKLVADGAIGRVVQTMGVGPHRLNLPTRPDWFFERDQFGGILCDIASHQIDQFLYFTDSTDAEIVASSVGNFANPSHPELEDFGEILLRSESAQGYIRVDWYTPDALPNWGDGRLLLLGTEGTIEMRKYVDVASRDGTDHLYLVNGDRCEYVDASDEPLNYFADLKNDVLHRTASAMSQTHCFKVMELALQAQAHAQRRGNLTGAV